MNSETIWMLGILISIILSLVIYLFKENISVLKSLKLAVEDMMIRLAVHQESEKFVIKSIESHQDRIQSVENQQVELKLKVNFHETILNQFKDGTNN